MKTRSLRLGVLGAGTVAQDHARAALALGHRIVSGSTRISNSPRWKAFTKVAPEARFVDADSMLADSELDAIVVCMPWHALPEWTTQLLACPKPMLLEKPIALASALLQTAIDGAGSAIVNKHVGFNRRFYKPVRRLAERLMQGGLKAADITISENVGRLLQRYGNAIAPHILAYSSCHILDLALHLFGPLVVESIHGYDDPGYPAPFRSYNGLLSARGVPVALSINADDPVHIGIRCRFDDHTHWHLSPIEHLCIYEGYDIEEPSPQCPIRRYRPRLIDSIVVDSTYKPGFLEQMTAFCENDSALLATPVESVRLLELVEQIQKSATVHSNRSPRS